MKKILSLIIASALVIGTLSMPINKQTTDVLATSNGKYNYVEALQKSMFFYEAQQAGPLPEWNMVSWRADSTMSDYVTGGLYDAGDHVKFNLPMAYTAAMLAWGLYEYGDGIEASGQREVLERNLEFILDYLVACDLGDKVVYQIGDGQRDHKWWGAAEMVELEMGVRPYYTCDASCVVGEMSAALAAGAAALKGRSDKTDTYIKHAKSLFELADTVRSDESYTEAAGFYDSWSGFWDELFWASNWLYIATDDNAYLDKATSYIPNLQRENQSTELKFTWAHCWDDVMQGAMLLYARSTGEPEYIKQFQKHLDFWSVGYGGREVKHIEGGLAWLDSWGCLRYATTTAFLAVVWSDYIDDEALIDRYTTFAETQINYALGDNPLDRSFVVGFGKNPPQRPHHRTSQGSWSDKDIDPPYHRHVLYGALVGGPGQDGSYTDDVQNYVNNEVATDYNAGYTALLCKMVSKYGGVPLEDFPVEEVPDGPEFYIEAGINQASDTFTELKVLATNHSAWPARVIVDLSYNYYFDLSEVFEAGYGLEDIEIKTGYDEVGDTQISAPIKYDGTIYYVKITYPDGSHLAPIGQSEHQLELQFRISVPGGTNFWDPTNDYSYIGLEPGNVMNITDRITMYDGDKLIYGTEPDGTTASDQRPVETTVTTEPIVTSETTTTGETSETTTPSETPISTDTTTDGGDVTDITTTISEETPQVTTTKDSEEEINWDEVLYGDVNLDGAVRISDVIEFNKYLVGVIDLSPTAKENANCLYDDRLDMADNMQIAKRLVHQITEEDLGPRV